VSPIPRDMNRYLLDDEKITEFVNKDEALQQIKDRIDSILWERFLEPPVATGSGEISGSNGMSRVNWFNGRFLTAEALRKQDRYWQLRTQLLAQIHTPGIAWGLGLQAPGAGPAPEPALPTPVIEVSQGPPRSVTFRAIDDNGAPLGGVHVELTLPDGSRRSLVTDANGGAKLDPGGNPGDYAFTISMVGFASVDGQATVREYGFHVDVSMSPGGTGETLPFPRAFEGGIGTDRELTLQPGVAFDAAGRPIVVGGPFRFSIDDLLDRYRAQPLTISKKTTSFAPCICVEPGPGTVFQPGAAIPEGPYLLVIEPTETAEGEAKVYGEICSGPSPVHCQADVWRDGFGLSLVSYPFQVPKNGDIRSSFDLRGTLSAHYFDVWEHSLVRRWDPTFAHDDRFCHSTGPRRHQPCAVPLAMLYVNHDGSVSFMDPWIPRRTQVATAARSWSENLFGTPTPAAAVARLHQFQCQLAETLEQVPLTIGGAAASRRPGPNLYERGFRHIPPVGFLPVDVGGFDFGTFVGRNGTLPTTGELTAYVCEHAAAHFEGTNVLTYCVVAPREDDVLEDIDNGFEKDPIVLRRVEEREREKAEIDWGELSNYKSGTSMMLVVIAAVLANTRMTVDALANRETEIVKLIVPLQGLRRVHPLVGQTSQDYADLAREWGAEGLAQSLSGSMAMAYMSRSMTTISTHGFPEEREVITVPPERGEARLGALPRSFVVYVKQRIVILELIFRVLTWFERYPWGRLSFRQLMTTRTPEPVSFVPTRTLRKLYEDSMPTETRVLTGALFKAPLMRSALLEGLEANAVEMRREGLRELLAEIDAEEERIRGASPDEAKPRLRAMENVVDVFAVEHPEYSALKLPLTILDEEAAEALIRDMAREFERNPAVDERGREIGASVAKEVLHGDTYRRWESMGAGALWSRVRSAMARQPAKEYMSTVATDVDLGAVLDSTPEDAEELAGGSAKFSSLKGKVKQAVNEMADGIELVAKDLQLGADLADEYAAALERTGDAKKAYAAAARAHPRGAKHKYLKALEPMANNLDEQGFAELAEMVFRKG